MENWISEQTSKINAEWGNVIKNFYPSQYPLWSNPQKHMRAIKEEWNFFDAVKSLNWNKIMNFGTNIKVLDLGAGTGWLSAYLSRFKNIGTIDALDSDEKNLNLMLPNITRMMEGDLSKINPILGLFQPLLVEDNHYDLIVASSAVHHAENLFSLMRELRRVLKKGGKLYILNETPHKLIKYILTLLKTNIMILIKVFIKKFTEFEQTISAGHILYDPYLGDRKYAYYQWIKAFTQAGFQYRVLPTPFLPYKKRRNQKIKITHFLCY